MWFIPSLLLAGYGFFFAAKIALLVYAVPTTLLESISLEKWFVNLRDRNFFMNTL